MKSDLGVSDGRRVQTYVSQLLYNTIRQFDKARTLYNRRQPTSTTTSIENLLVSCQSTTQQRLVLLQLLLPITGNITSILQLRHQLLVRNQLPPSSIHIIYSDHPLSSHLRQYIYGYRSFTSFLIIPIIFISESVLVCNYICRQTHLLFSYFSVTFQLT